MRLVVAAGLASQRAGRRIEFAAVAEAPEVAEGSDERLRELASQLDAYGWAAELLDRRWHLAWVSSELLTMYGERDPERVGLGEHVFVSRVRARRRGTITKESGERWLRTNGPFLLDSAGDGHRELANHLDSWEAEILEECDPSPAPCGWASTLDFSRDEFFGRVNYVAQRVHAPDGELVGYLFLYTIDMPASVATLLMRGDRAMHERMAALVHPGQRSLAVLFADLEGSGSLSRRLASPVYFRLIRDIRTALEATVSERGGIVGKHAGDGVTALFLSEQLGSESGAARAALETARSLPDSAKQAAAALADEALPVDVDGCRLKVAVHWGPSLYVGQIATQSRLEISALGDEMNEGARIEQVAAGDQVLASKPLLERLSEDDASAVGLDPERIAYRALAEIEGASEKARRDAGSIAVADVREAS
jgi:class 3 adenylate cyclase